MQGKQAWMNKSHPISQTRTKGTTNIVHQKIEEPETNLPDTLIKWPIFLIEFIILRLTEGRTGHLYDLNLTPYHKKGPNGA